MKEIIRRLEIIEKKLLRLPEPAPYNQVRITEDGGIAIKLTAGENLVKGNIVYVSAANTVKKCLQNNPDVIGVVYISANNATNVWVVVSGVAYVYFTGNTTPGHIARGFVTSDGGYVAGQALSEAYPTSPFASDKHFYEVGHVIEARTGAGLAKCVLHFN